jgi:FixH
MTAEDEVIPQERWQRNPWVWLIIAIPSLTVAGCLVTIYLALTRPDYLVSEDAGALPEVERPLGEPPS